MKKGLKTFFLIFLISVVPTILIWAPFLLRLPEFWSIPLPDSGMATVIANYDGPLYIVVAKTFYNTALIKQMFSFPLPVIYYAAHFPLFPILIWGFGSVLKALFGNALGFPWGMLIATLASSMFAIYYFRKLSLEHIDKKDVLFLTFVFAIFPARWLIVRSVGTPEPLFVGAIIASIYYFEKKNYWLAGVFGLLAQLTKSPAILLFASYFVYLFVQNFSRLANTRLMTWVKKFDWKAYPVLLIPAGLLGIFFIYGKTFGDYLAYFHSGDNIHLLFPPFQIFDYSQPWTGTFWLEEVIFVYLFGMLGIMRLFKEKLSVQAWFTAIFFTSTLFVSHRDIIRYSLPIVPFLLIAFSPVIAKKEFKIIMAILIIPIYLFSLAFISNNVMPISDWGPLL